MSRQEGGLPRVRRLFPWVFMLGGVILAPWVVWAPLLGGLSFGLLLIQTGLLQRWLDERQLAAGRVESESGVGYCPMVGETVLRRSNRGWLLVAFLVLVGAQAAMLLVTLNIKNHESALAAQGVIAAQRDRAELRRQLLHREDDRNPAQGAGLPPGAGNQADYGALAAQPAEDGP